MKGRRAALVRTASVAGIIAILAVGCGGASENAETPEQETVMGSVEKTPPADTTPPETTIDSGPTGTVNGGLISATVETDPVPRTGDAADDAAIWIDRRDRSRSTVIGTDKQGGLVVYDLSGRQIQYLPVGDVNNVDVRSDTDAGPSFVLGGEPVSLVTAGNRGDNSIGIYKVIADTRQLQDVAARVINPGIETYGSCM